MPNREDVLREETFKGQVEDVQSRVFYTLSKEKNLQPHRNSKAIALLISALVKKGALTDAELDELLLSAVS